MMIVTSLASMARPFWRLLELYKVDPAFIFREAGLDPALMDKPRERYSFERRVAAWTKAADLIDDPCFGMRVVEVWSPTDLHALGYAFYASSTLRTALGRLARYAHVLKDDLGFDLDDDGDQVTFTLQTHKSPILPPPVPQEDFLWAYLLHMCRTSAGEQFKPVQVRFFHSPPSCEGDYRVYFRCPVSFDSDRSEIRFDRKDVDRPLPTSNMELASANDHILTDYLNKLQKDDLVTRVKIAIAEELPSGSPTEDVMAKSVFMSSRTLHRKLSALGTNYSQLLTSVRRDLAEQYVKDPSLSLSEISFLLGFSEQSAFSRAYRRWTGQAPSAARESSSALAMSSASNSPFAHADKAVLR